MKNTKAMRTPSWNPQTSKWKIIAIDLRWVSTQTSSTSPNHEASSEEAIPLNFPKITEERSSQIDSSPAGQSWNSSRTSSTELLVQTPTTRAPPASQAAAIITAQCWQTRSSTIRLKTRRSTVWEKTLGTTCSTCPTRTWLTLVGSRIRPENRTFFDSRRLLQRRTKRTPRFSRLLKTTCQQLWSLHEKFPNYPLRYLMLQVSKMIFTWTSWTGAARTFLQLD